MLEAIKLWFRPQSALVAPASITLSMFTNLVLCEMMGHVPINAVEACIDSANQAIKVRLFDKQRPYLWQKGSFAAWCASYSDEGEADGSEYQAEVELNLLEMSVEAIRRHVARYFRDIP